MSNDTEGLEFPCRWPVKAMTRAADGALARVVDTVARHVGEFDREEVSVRPSRNGRYQSVTVIVEAESRAQLERIYTELRALDAVVMTL